jgi:hypothetical protein
LSANKRKPEQRLADRAQIARRYLHGETQTEIGASLALTQQQISYDLQQIQREWLRSAVRDYDERKAEELARLDELERTYWAAWERSKADLVHSFSETSDAEVTVRVGHKRAPAQRKRRKEYTRIEAQNGNSAFLYGVERCIAQRCKILGLCAPADVSVHGTMTFADLFSLAQRPGGADQPPRLAVLPGGESPTAP